MCIYMHNLHVSNIFQTFTQGLFQSVKNNPFKFCFLYFQKIDQVTCFLILTKVIHWKGQYCHTCYCPYFHVFGLKESWWELEAKKRIKMPYVLWNVYQSGVLKYAFSLCMDHFLSGVLCDNLPYNLKLLAGMAPRLFSITSTFWQEKQYDLDSPFIKPLMFPSNTKSLQCVYNQHQ